MNAGKEPQKPTDDQNQKRRGPLPWFRFYTEVLDDPKVQLLPLDQYKFWTSCLCFAARNDGYLSPLHAVSFAFHMPEKTVEEMFQVLREKGLLDERRGMLTPHNWFKRQYKSDLSTTRVKQFRKRRVKRFTDVSETPSETENRVQRQNHQTP